MISCALLGTEASTTSRRYCATTIRAAPGCAFAGSWRASRRSRPSLPPPRGWGRHRVAERVDHQRRAPAGRMQHIQLGARTGVLLRRRWPFGRLGRLVGPHRGRPPGPLSRLALAWPERCPPMCGGSRFALPGPVLNRPAEPRQAQGSLSASTIARQMPRRRCVLVFSTSRRQIGSCHGRHPQNAPRAPVAVVRRVQLGAGPL
jgi:hypothetical protein